ncbi:formin-A-like isoform X1 [Acanthochromis polyacanthus]|uniref:formin-A-like isoform X1 n=1 Tax=Acanthochromis polyacanthus TaxID=80966 RepID=UPI002233E8E2|nr:formin-A-like isoform X1 [Acanthochromis polyacanthus]
MSSWTLDAPDEAAAIQALEEADEGFVDDGEGPTVFELEPPSASTASAARSGDPADAPRSEPSSPAAPGQDAPPEAPEGPTQNSSDSEEDIQGPDGQPGYQHVLKLAKALVEIRNLQGLSDRRVDRLIALWQRLPEADKRRVVYPARHRERQPTGRFKAAKGKNTSCPGKESLQLCLLGLNTGPANWPSASRLVKAICSQLCRLHPATAHVGGVPKTWWSLVLTDYVAIREAVLVSPRLMAQTTIQLFELNQRTLSQWFCRCQKAWERTVLEQGTGIVPAPVVADRPLPAAKQLSLVQVGQRQPFIFPGLQEQPGPSAGGQPAPPHPAAFGSAAVAASATAAAAATTAVVAAAPPPPPSPPPPPPHPPAFSSAPAAPPLPGQTKLPRTTAYRKRKAAEAAAAAAAAGECGLYATTISTVLVLICSKLLIEVG